ncbi:MAG TPA: glycosyltransferase [Candidatus Diapherotrites archaeon]|uniref:Glycosyltransferase n=1 Tax=Candidatus Iainarchaeum sp. TaxID=3101447 RepID=A0A7J4JDM4_9ARCH|nr:glycosyltransferase [Candidatus Diapherotrites archaeon]HIH15862.1 glycosyltransferase [Candidatus Diapherotrites archaeon]
MGVLGYFSGNPVMDVLLVWLALQWEKGMGTRGTCVKYSFVVPVRNRKGIRLHNALLSLRQQQFPKNQYEIIVVDYGGHDGLEAWVKERVPGVCYLYTHENGPFNEARAKNIGIRQAKGEFVISTNADILFEKHFLLALDALFAVFPDRLALCLRYDFDQQTVEAQGTRLVEKMDSLTRFASTVQRSHWWAGDCQASSKHNFELLRGFNEEFTGWGRLDNDLRTRMEEAGKRLFWLNPFTYIAHQNHDQNREEITAQEKRNDQILAKKYPDFRRNLEQEWGRIKP